MGQLAPRTQFRGIPATFDVPVLEPPPTRRSVIHLADPLVGWCPVIGPIAPVVLASARRRGPAGGPGAGFLRMRRTLPLPTLAPIRDRVTRYGMAAMDDRGRIADRVIVDALGWTPDTTLAAEPSDGGVILVRPVVGGALRPSASRHLRLPAATRHRCGLVPGDRLLLAADPSTGELTIYPPTVLDELITRHRAGGNR